MTMKHTMKQTTAAELQFDIAIDGGLLRLNF
jgi:hypothetical protein